MNNTEFVNLEEVLKGIVDIKSYINIVREVAEATNNYRLVDKIHYLVNEKLGIDSNFYALSETGLSNHVTYCAQCGEYLHHNNMFRDVWYIQVEDDEFRLCWLIHFTPWEEDDEWEEELCINCERD